MLTYLNLKGKRKKKKKTQRQIFLNILTLLCFLVINTIAVPVIMAAKLLECLRK